VAGVELSIVPQQGGGVPIAVAKEAIPDDHFDFEFFHTLPNDSIAPKLKKAIANNDWRSIRDALSNLAENRRAKKTKNDPFILELFPQKYEKPGQRREPKTMLPFVPFWMIGSKRNQTVLTVAFCVLKSEPLGRGMLDLRHWRAWFKKSNGHCFMRDGKLRLQSSKRLIGWLHKTLLSIPMQCQLQRV